MLPFVKDPCFGAGVGLQVCRRYVEDGRASHAEIETLPGVARVLVGLGGRMVA